jgi:SPOR domain
MAGTIRNAGVCQQWVWLLLAAVTAAGCESSNKPPLDRANEAYQKQQYAQSYELSSRLAQGAGPGTYDAAYLAGMSAYRLKRATEAEQYLLKAAQSTDQALVGAASAQLGLIYAEQERYDAATRALLAAAVRLRGQDRANAYLNAGLAQQRLGQWAEAKNSLALARRSSGDAAFQARVDQNLRTTGWTVQVGAFSEQANAQRAAEQIAPRARLLNLGAPRLVPATEPNGRRLTLVHVGYFTTHASADIARRRLGQADALVAPVSQ